MGSHPGHIRRYPPSGGYLRPSGGVACTPQGVCYALVYVHYIHLYPPLGDGGVVHTLRVHAYLLGDATPSPFHHLQEVPDDLDLDLLRGGVHHVVVHVHVHVYTALLPCILPLGGWGWSACAHACVPTQTSCTWWGIWIPTGARC